MGGGRPRLGRVRGVLPPLSVRPLADRRPGRGTGRRRVRMGRPRSDEKVPFRMGEMAGGHGVRHLPYVP